LVKKKFINKVILITGASSGLGKTFTEYFIGQGAYVAICARRISFLKKNYEKNRNVFFYKLDLQNYKSLKKFVNIILKKFDKIDILINNAAVAIPEKIDKIKDRNLEQSFKTNVFAPALLIKEVLKIMKKNNYGRIINISSGGSVNCAENYFSYSASKAALNTLTKTLAKEIKKYNIKINSMSPGPCKTRMFPKNKLSTKLSLPTIEYLSSLPTDGPSGKFFWFMNEINIFPDLSHIDWKKPRSLKK